MRAGRILAAFLAELRLEARRGFGLAFLLTALVYALALGILPPAWRAEAAALLASTDPLFFSLFFSGAFLVAARGDGTFRALLATPLRPEAWALRRGAVAFAYSCAAGLLMALLAAPRGLLPAPFAAAELAGCALAAPLGLAGAARARSMNGFLFSAAPALALLGLPFILVAAGGEGSTLASAAPFLPGGLPWFLLREAFGAKPAGAALPRLAAAAAALGWTALAWAFAAREIKALAARLEGGL